MPPRPGLRAEHAHLSFGEIGHARPSHPAPGRPKPWHPAFPRPRRPAPLSGPGPLRGSVARAPGRPTRRGGRRSYDSELGGEAPRARRSRNASQTVAFESGQPPTPPANSEPCSYVDPMFHVEQVRRPPVGPGDRMDQARQTAVEWTTRSAASVDRISRGLNGSSPAVLQGLTPYSDMATS